MKKLCIIIILLSAFWAVNTVAQNYQAYIGGNNTLPVLGSETYDLQTTIYGFSSQLRWCVSDTPGDFIYTGTVYYLPELNLYKIDAASNTIVASAPVPYTVLDMETGENDQYLFHHNQQSVYKVSTSDLATVDSINTGRIITYIEVYDDNTVYAAATERILKLDFNTHSITDSVVFGTFENPAEMVLNNDKTKIFAYKASLPLTLYVVDIVSNTLETTVSLSGMLGGVGDLILSNDGSRLFVTSTGSASLSGTIRVIKTDDLSAIGDFEKDYGYGAMSFAPNGDLWIPNNASNTITVFDPAQPGIKETFSTQSFLAGPFCVAFGKEGSVGTHETGETRITVYPNPADDFLYLKDSKAPINGQLRIYDITGSLVLFERINPAGFDISHLEIGIYFVDISNGSDRFTEKILVR